MQTARQKGCMQCAHPHRGMTTQDSQRLRGAAGNMGLEPEDLGLNFTVTTSLSICSFVHHLEPQSPTSLAPGTSFMEDNFSSDQGWRNGLGMIQVHYIYCALLLLLDSDAGRDWGQEEKGTTEDEMAGWHH